MHWDSLTSFFKASISTRATSSLVASSIFLDLVVSHSALNFFISSSAIANLSTDNLSLTEYQPKQPDIPGPFQRLGTLAHQRRSDVHRITGGHMQLLLFSLKLVEIGICYMDLPWQHCWGFFFFFCLSLPEIFRTFRGLHSWDFFRTSEARSSFSLLASSLAQHSASTFTTFIATSMTLGVRGAVGLRG